MPGSTAADLRETQNLYSSLRPAVPLEALRLFYGTTRERLKILRRRNRLIGLRDRLCLGQDYFNAEDTACEQFAREIYYGKLLEAAGFQVENDDYEAAAAAYVLGDREGLFHILESVYLNKRKVAQLAEEAYHEMGSLQGGSWLANEENGPVIAITDGMRIQHDYRLARVTPDLDQCEGYDFQVFSNSIPFDEVLLGTADVPLSRFWIWGMEQRTEFWVHRAPNYGDGDNDELDFVERCDDDGELDSVERCDDN